MGLYKNLGYVSLAAAAAAYAWQRYWYYPVDGRTPEWMREFAASHPWRRIPPLCAAGKQCKFTEADFWSPPNDTLTKAITDSFFAATWFPFRLQLASLALHRRCLRNIDAGSFRPAGIIQIGPNVLGADEVITLRALTGACFGNAKLVLVEPQEPIIKDLAATAVHVGLGPDRTRVVNAAMCPTSGHNLTLYKFKDGLCSDAEMNHAITMWSTLGGKDVLINTWKRNFLQRMIPTCIDDTELEASIFGVDVPCHTPATLLELTGMKASEVDFLFIDAEGYDAEILDLFNSLPDFDPTTIVFEWAFHHASRGKLPLVVKVANYWSDRGYLMYKDFDNLVMAKMS